MALHVRAVALPDEVERDIYVVGDRLTYEPVAGAETVVRSGWAVPGLVDAHCHLGLVPPGVAATVEQARELAMVDRATGVLTIRDAGSPTPYAELDDEPEMPRLLRAGRHIAPPKRYLPNIAVDAAGPELAAAVAEQAKAGNGWVKLVGDWIDRAAGDLGTNYDRESLTAAVKAAHDNGARITVHTFSEDALPDLLAAGLDCIEHGTGLSPDLLDIMAKAGTALVPTMINIETFGGIAEKAQAKFPTYADHMRRLMAGFPSVVAAAHEAGVPIFAGTDAGGGIDHGLIAREIVRLHQAGMSTVDALAAGSWKARDWLGLSGLVEGGLADLVVYAEDPRRDLRTLAKPARMILRGRVIR
ncbi:amidohydrolase family protein [Fodinicola acaciae]|uniref:amidohydrolase family protein n=1 Tax=Fodinicola acaciae TaxID=2681555 RepID=UPI0013D6DC57|nr:amidohydrolase family protein [Fodinicola acaciae]